MDADQYDEFLEPLPADRRDAVKAWLASELEKPCPECSKPVRVMDPHQVIKAGVAHRACAEAA